MVVRVALLLIAIAIGLLALTCPAPAESQDVSGGKGYEVRGVGPENPPTPPATGTGLR